MHDDRFPGDAPEPAYRKGDSALRHTAAVRSGWYYNRAHRGEDGTITPGAILVGPFESQADAEVSRLAPDLERALEAVDTIRAANGDHLYSDVTKVNLTPMGRRIARLIKGSVDPLPMLRRYEAE